MEEKTPVIKIMFEKGDYNKFMNIFKCLPWEAEMNKHPEDIHEQWDFFKIKFLEAESLCVLNNRVYIGGKLSKKFSCNLDKKKLSENWKEKKRCGGGDLKRFWKYTQSKLKTRANVPDLQVPGTENSPKFTSSDTEKAEVLLQYFSSVFIVEQPNENMPLFQKRVFEMEIDSIDISEDMVRKKLLKLKINKSPGPDAIHPRVLQEIAEAISKPLTIIFRSSLRNRELPDEWKHANVSSIHKSGPRPFPKTIAQSVIH